MATVMATLWQPCFRTVAICTPPPHPHTHLADSFPHVYPFFAFGECRMGLFVFGVWGIVTGGGALLAFSPWGRPIFPSVITDQKKVKQNTYFA